MLLMVDYPDSSKFVSGYWLFLYNNLLKVSLILISQGFTEKEILMIYWKFLKLLLTRFS